MNTPESTTNPNDTPQFRKLVAAAAIGALSFIGVDHNAGAQEAPATTSPEYSEPAEGHELERPAEAVTTTMAAPAPEYVEPAPGHEVVRPADATTTTTASPAPEYVEPAPGHEVVRPADATTTTTASPAVESAEHTATQSDNNLPHTGLAADTLALSAGAAIGAGALVAATAKRKSNKLR